MGRSRLAIVISEDDRQEALTLDRTSSVEVSQVAGLLWKFEPGSEFVGEADDDFVGQ
jgi:hypothetical protein